MPKQKQMNFEAYPTRGITLSNQVWDELKAAKLKHGKNWNAFIKELLIALEGKNGS